MNISTEYILPFNQENFGNLYKQKPTGDSTSISLVMMAEGSSDRPRLVTNVEQFKGPRDPLWQDLTTPT